MGNILTARVTIEGTRPLFWHKFGPEALPLEKQEKTGVAGHDPSEWRKTCMVTKDGQLYLDPSYVFATIRNGGRYVTKKRSNILKDIAATMQVVDNRILVDRFWPGYPNGHDFDAKTVDPAPDDPDAPVYIDVRGVVNPSTKGRNVRYRVAASPGWSTSFSILWDKTIVSRGEMEAAVIEAGKLVGIGNGRAIGMGRFQVTSFEVLE